MPKNANQSTDGSDEMIPYSKAAERSGTSVSAVKNAVSKGKFVSLFEGHTSVYHDPFGRPDINLVSASAVDAWIEARKQAPSDGRGNRRGGMRFYKIRVPDSRYDEYVSMITEAGFEAPTVAHTGNASTRAKRAAKEVAAQPAPTNLEVEAVANNGAEVELVEA